jgi:hypothetical protein
MMKKMRSRGFSIRLVSITSAAVLMVAATARAASFSGLEPGQSLQWHADRQLGPDSAELIPGLRYRYQRNGGGVSYIDVICDRESRVIEYIDIYPSRDLFREQACEILELTGVPERMRSLGGQCIDVYDVEGVILYYDGTGDNSRIRFITCIEARQQNERKISESAAVLRAPLDTDIIEIPRIGVMAREGRLPGVEIVSVNDGSRARQAGLSVGDRIIEVAGFIFSDTDCDAERFREAMNVLPDDQPLDLTCERGGVLITSSIVLEPINRQTAMISEEETSFNAIDNNNPYLRFLRNLL